MLGLDRDTENYQKGHFVDILVISVILGTSVIFLFGQSFAQTIEAPDQPVGVTAVAISPTSISLNWSPPQNNGGSPITGYRIDYRIAPNISYSTVATLNNVTTYTHANLITDKTYIYRIYAINSIGPGSPAPEVSATPNSNSAPPKNVTPNPPQNLVALTYSSTQINLSWGAPVSNGGPAVSGYKIEYSLDSANFTNIVANSGSSFTAYSHTGLQTGHTYTYRVFAINSIGTSDSSNTATNTLTQVITVPGSPTLSANPSSDTSVSLSWIPPSNDGGSAITGYKIEYANNTSQYVILVANTGNLQTGYIHSGLVTGTTYSYRVTAINSIGAGNPSNIVTAQPQETKTPTVTTAIAISPTSVKISWIQPSQTYGQIVSGYKIDQVINGNFLPVDDTTSGVTSYTIPNLTTGKTYTFAVTALLSGGSQTNPSPLVSVTPTSTSSAPSSSDQLPQTSTPPQNQAIPDPPSNVNATLISQNTVQISWVLPSNNGKLPVTGFKIESKTGSTGTWYIVTSNTGVQTSFIKSGLQAGTTYYYRVSSISNVGTSQPSDQAVVTTQSDSSQPPIQSPPPVQLHSQGMIPVFNTTSMISYDISGGQILGISVNPDTYSLNINIKSDSQGILSIQIPREMIDAKKLDGTDDTYIVTNDKSIAQFSETKTTSYRTLAISFPANTSFISVYGTTAVPEFPISLIVFIIAFIPAIIFSKRITKY
ncbi:MAG TPA: fibronectin type III domain-containing protein [Candidatus Nitrosotalea sp.]|nr:fibronectin type III domain-containing protein [Candidatus Nitrosotalea sp.]